MLTASLSFKTPDLYAFADFNIYIFQQMSLNFNSFEDFEHRSPASS